MSSADAAKALKAKKGALIDGREANVDFSTPRPASGDQGNYRERANSRANAYGDAPSQPSDTLFIGNLSFEATQDIIAEEFGKFGSIQGVRLPTEQ